MKWESWEINGHYLEYNEDSHVYVCDGIQVPSITQLIKFKFPMKYNGIRQEVLDEAARKGTLLHATIEAAENSGDAWNYKLSDVQKEVRQEFCSYLLMKRSECFTAVKNEVPIVIPYNGEIIAAGRLDAVILDNKDRLGLADYKRTSKLDATYLSYQLTLYSIGYEYCYHQAVEFLRCIWMREDKHKYKEIPFCYDLANELLEEVANGVYSENQGA